MLSVLSSYFLFSFIILFECKSQSNDNDYESTITTTSIQQDYITQDDLNSIVSGYGKKSPTQECDMTKTGVELTYSGLELVPNIYNDTSYCYRYTLEQNLDQWSCENSNASIWKQVTINPCSNHNLDNSALNKMWHALRPYDGKLSIFTNKDSRLEIQGLVIRNGIVELRDSYNISICLDENYEMSPIGDYCITFSNHYQSCFRHNSNLEANNNLMVPNICNE